MSDKTQVHEIYFMAEDENKKMVMLEDYIESLADIHKLKKRITELEAQLKERDELAATVERLREAILDYQNKNHDLNILLVAATKTPRQNLNAIKREVLLDLLLTMTCSEHVEHYVNQRYPDKDGE